ncbi:MAG: TIGR02594 family protein [Chitinophagaceae bacterium]|nr:TIGR02594 family protein [Chitinophagaceae bacterium]
MSEPKYIKIARSQIGVKEKIGMHDNPKIFEYLEATTFRSSGDMVPWCAAFVCWCLEECKIQSTRSAWALSYLRWGNAVSKPELYDIAVLKRQGGGHVAFIVGVDESLGTIQLLGGNQHDAVNITNFHVDDVLSYRRPFLIYDGVSNV